MTASKISKEDAALLKYAGLMGHAFVGISGKPGERRKSCECGTMPQCRIFMTEHENATVYRKIGKGKWQLVWTGD